MQHAALAIHASPTRSAARTDAIGCKMFERQERAAIWRKCRLIIVWARMRSVRNAECEAFRCLPCFPRVERTGNIRDPRWATDTGP